jgi:hypothetical protein
MFEETLVCDGCSRVIDAGSRDRTLVTLRDGGRAFVSGRRGWEEIPASEPWGRSRRHLGACCAERDKFYDGDPVPTALDDKQQEER